MKANQPMEWKHTSVHTHILFNVFKEGYIPLEVVCAYVVKSLIWETEAHTSFRLFTCPKSCPVFQITTLPLNIYDFCNDKYLTALKNSRLLHIYQMIQAEKPVLCVHVPL